MDFGSKSPGYLTPRQMAEETGFPEESIRSALRRRELPYIRLGLGRGRGYWIRREAFEQWLKDKEIGALCQGHAGQPGADS